MHHDARPSADDRARGRVGKSSGQAVTSPPAYTWLDQGPINGRSPPSPADPSGLIAAKESTGFSGMLAQLGFAQAPGQPAGSPDSELLVWAPVGRVRGERRPYTGTVREEEG